MTQKLTPVPDDHCIAIARKISDVLDGEELGDVTTVLTSLLIFAIGSGSSSLDDKLQALERTIEILRRRIPELHNQDAPEIEDWVQ
jgi:hypothetical protein